MENNENPDLIDQWTDFYIKTKLMNEFNDELDLLIKHINRAKDRFKNSSNITLNIDRLNKRKFFEIKYYQLNKNMSMNMNNDMKYQDQDQYIPEFKYKEIFPSNPLEIPNEAIKADVIIYVNFLLERLNQLESTLDKELFKFSSFLDENINYYKERMSDINVHLMHIKNYTSEFIKEQYAEKKKKLREIKDNNAKIHSHHNHTDNDFISLTDNENLKENETDELRQPLLDKEFTKKKLFDEERIEDYKEYQSTYELAIKELHKEFYYVNNFVEQNSEKLNEVHKQVSRQLDSLINLISSDKSFNKIKTFVDKNNTVNNKNLKKRYFKSEKNIFKYLLSGNLNLNLNDNNESNAQNKKSEKKIQENVEELGKIVDSKNILDKNLNLNPNLTNVNTKTNTNKYSNEFDNLSFYFIGLTHKTKFIQDLSNKYNVNSYNSIVDNLKCDLEDIFEFHFSKKYTHLGISPTKVLKENSEISTFSKFQIFTFGFLLGILVIFLIIQVFLAYYFGFDIEYNLNFKSVFPIYRGYFLTCIFLWILGWNVYVWTRNNINYKLCFLFTNSSSTLYEILNRAAIFTIILIASLFGYILSRNHMFYTIFNHFEDHESHIYDEFKGGKEKVGIANSPDPQDNITIWLYNDIFPFSCWLVLLVYMFFPSTDKANLFNYNGRKYFFYLLLDCLLSPIYFIFDICFLIYSELRTVSNDTSAFISSIIILTLNTNNFKHVWFADQLTSFIGPLRDIEYSVCYLRYYDTDPADKIAICHSSRFYVLYFTLLPNIIRLFQCLRTCLLNRNFFPQIINAGKYSMAIIVTVLAHYYRVFPEESSIFTYWSISAIISTLYSSAWDLKYDFGFLSENNFPFREKLSYKTLSIYYIIVITNILLRFGWVLTLSPEILDDMLYPEFSMLLIYFFEIFRRGIWNFIRVEYEHVKLCDEFKVSIEVELPLALYKNEKTNQLYIYDNIIKKMTEEALMFDDYKNSKTKDINSYVSNVNIEFDSLNFSNSKTMTSDLKMNSISASNRQEIVKDNDDYIKHTKSIRLDKNANKFEKMLSNINEKSNVKNENDSSSDSDDERNIIINSKNRNVGKIKNLIK